MVKFLRAGPVPYSHPVGSLTYNYSFNHHHMSKTPKHKSPTSDLLLEFWICVSSCLFHISSQMSQSNLTFNTSKDKCLIVICKPVSFFFLGALLNKWYRFPASCIDKMLRVHFGGLFPHLESIKFSVFPPLFSCPS